MRASPEIQEQIKTSTFPTSRYARLRISCWSVLLALGAAQAWATRFTMNPDGISYLDIGDAYWRGDWHNAINAYWSPLYSWILGFFLKVVKPSAYWEYPLVHLVNFFIYVAALGCFEFFLNSFIATQSATDHNSNRNEAPIAQSSWWLLGYTLFLSTSILMIGLSLVTPDMCVAAFVFLASGLVLRTRAGAGRRAYAYLGLVLGLAYLSKGVMFLLAFLFLAAAFYKNNSRDLLKNGLIAVIVFLVMIGPFVAALSFVKGRPTFGDVGPIAYEVYVDGVDLFIPKEPAVAHTVNKILDKPATYEFEHPIAGTYPLWYDPTYWHAGLKPYWNLTGQLQAIKYALQLYFSLLTTLQLNLLVPLLMLLLISSRPMSYYKRILERWPLIVPAFAAVVLYTLVYSEPRYLGPFVLLLWMAVFSGLRFPDLPSMKKFVGLAISAIAATTLFFVGELVVHQVLAGQLFSPVYWQVADTLKHRGLKENDRLAVLASEPFGEGGAFVARLNRAKIIVESTDINGEWVKDDIANAGLTESLKRAGIRAALWYGKRPENSAIPWKRLGQTNYYSYFILDADRFEQNSTSAEALRLLTHQQIVESELKFCMLETCEANIF